MQTHEAGGTRADPQDRYVDDVEAANLLSLSRSYLRQRRLKGGGPPFSSFGRAVRYRLGDLYDWAASKSARSTSEREVA